MNKIKVIGYVRVSTKGQVQSGASELELKDEDFRGHSIAEQVDKIKKFCEFKDFNLDKIFEDPGVSAKKIWFFDRNTGVEICNYLDNNPDIKYIIVKLQDRLFRDAEDALKTVRVLKDKYDVGLYIQSNGDMINLDIPDQKLLFGMKALMDEHKVATSNQRTKQSLQHKRDVLGKKLGRAPLGYKRNEDNTNFIPKYSTLKLICRAYRYRVIQHKKTKEIISELGISRYQLINYVKRYEQLKNIPEIKRYYYNR